MGFTSTLESIPMQRDLKELANTPFDLVVIGGGIYGAFSAWDAAMRGLSVALIDRGDFGGATSFNSLRIIHGGLRYVQHLDFRRMRQSIRERATLLRIAPHLIRPLPCLVSTCGHLKRGRELISLALRINDLIGFDRNRGQPLEKYLPDSHTISREECLRLVPGLRREALTGGAVWFDAQIRNSERLVLSVIHSAVNAGTRAANHVEAIGFLLDDSRVVGVKVRDNLTGDLFEVRAKVVLNASGPWVDQVVERLGRCRRYRPMRWSRAVNLVVRREIFPDHAVGLWSQRGSGGGDRTGKGSSRLLLIVPWRGYSLIGTSHTPHPDAPDDFHVTRAEVSELLEEINAAYPPASIRPDDVSFFLGGLLPMEGARDDGRDVILVKRYRICDHMEEDGVEGLISVIGVKLTTARDVAQRAIDRVFRKLGKEPPACRTADVPIHGGETGPFEDYQASELRRDPLRRLDPEISRRLVCAHGSAYPDVLKLVDSVPGGEKALTPSSKIVRGEALFSVREEMARKLSDLIMRRFGLGMLGDPGDRLLNACADLMGDELGWNFDRKEREIRETKATFTLID